MATKLTARYKKRLLLIFAQKSKKPVMSAVNPLKALYHASTTLICNYLCSLMDIGFDCLEKSGLERALAQKSVEPLSTETLKNIFATGTTQALTEPIARGDVQSLNNQIEAIESFTSEHSRVFKALSKQALNIASGKTSTAKLADISDLLLNDKN